MAATVERRAISIRWVVATPTGQMYERAIGSARGAVALRYIPRITRFVFAFAAVSAALFVVPSAAWSEASVAVENLGQPGLESERPQPPVVVAARGACSDPLDVAAANGGPSPCPGVWPAMGSAGWAPVVEIAGGDALELRFSQPMTQVRVSVMSNLDPSVVNPDGVQSSNEAVLAPTNATVGDDPLSWRVSIPRPVSGWALGGTAFSITAKDDEDEFAFGLSLRAPRFGDYVAQCGIAHYFTLVNGLEGSTESCDRHAPPPGIPPRTQPPTVPPPPPGGELPPPSPPPPAARPAPRPVPVATLASSQLRVRDGAVRIRLRVQAPGRLSLRLTSGRKRLATAHRPVRFAGQVTHQLRLSRTARRTMGRRTQARLTVTMRTAGRSVAKTWPVTIRRR
jgi:hypothetical protein